MWWVVSLIGLVSLAVEAVITTFFVLVALNGLPSVPDGFVILYLLGGSGFVLASSFLAGKLAARLAERGTLPLWLAGGLTIFGAIILLPIVFFICTFALLLVFGLL